MVRHRRRRHATAEFLNKRVQINQSRCAYRSSLLSQMLTKTLGDVEIAEQCTLRHTVVCPPILAILTQQWRQRPGRRSGVPRRQCFTKCSQGASP